MNYSFGCAGQVVTAALSACNGTSNFTLTKITAWWIAITNGSLAALTFTANNTAGTVNNLLYNFTNLYNNMESVCPNVPSGTYNLTGWHNQDVAFSLNVTRNASLFA